MDSTTVCALCGKRRGNHKAKTLHCPLGMKTRVGYTTFGAGIFQPKVFKRRKRCSQCGKLEDAAALVSNVDCAGITHHMHQQCLDMLAAWLRVGGSKERPGDKELAERFNAL